MPYVRRVNGDLTGEVFAAPQPGYADEWMEPDAPELVAAAETSERAARLAEVKARAHADIIGRYPDWKQRNMLAVAIEELVLQLQGEGLTIDVTKVQPVVDAWQWIQARRAQSDAEEAAL